VELVVAAAAAGLFRAVPRLNCLNQAQPFSPNHLAHSHNRPNPLFLNLARQPWSRRQDHPHSLQALARVLRHRAARLRFLNPRRRNPFNFRRLPSQVPANLRSRANLLSPTNPSWASLSPLNLHPLSPANLPLAYLVNLSLVNLSLVNLSLVNLSLVNLSLVNLSLASPSPANPSLANPSLAKSSLASLSLVNLFLVNLFLANLSPLNHLPHNQVSARFLLNLWRARTHLLQLPLQHPLFLLMCQKTTTCAAATLV